ncbi:MAG: ATP phosphoribosyltransferase [Proteobacteria bacterium]|nr:ATP phosphoribosyltransferase [Pseudomonadota bacterium]
MASTFAGLDELVIAVSKGRILREALPLLAAAGIEPCEDPDVSRKLILETSKPNIKLVIIRAADVPTFVEYGAADVGIAGKDVLLEYEGNGYYEPLDLKIAACRLMLAGRGPVDNSSRRLRVATKYAATTRRYFAEKGVQIEIVKLYGSMELAPLVGLADYIVDLVDTGNTLKANGLIAMEHVRDVTSRLIVNKASMKIKHAQITGLIGSLAAVVA